MNKIIGLVFIFTLIPSVALAQWRFDAVSKVVEYPSHSFAPASISSLEIDEYLECRETSNVIGIEPNLCEDDIEKESLRMLWNGLKVLEISRQCLSNGSYCKSGIFVKLNEKNLIVYLPSDYLK